MRTGLRALVTVCTVAMLGACGFPGGGTTPSIASDVALAGGTWVLDGGTINGRPIDVPDGSRITLTAGEDDEVGGSSGCNGYGATLDIDGDRVEFNITGGTDMGCASEVMAAEDDYLEALEQVTSGSRQDRTLHLSGPDVALTFELSEPAPIEDISGTEWHLESLVVDGGRTPAQGERARLLLDGDGTLTGSTGCRQLHGRYDTFGDRIDFPDFRAEGDCPADLQEQDSHVVRVLGDGFRAELQGQELLVTSNGNAGLVYRRGSS